MRVFYTVIVIMAISLMPPGGKISPVRAAEPSSQTDARHNREPAHPPHVSGGLGLTLSGGGAKGLAHIGVLHIIDSLGIKVDYITGTSMGSIVGGLYASGYSAAEIERLALEMDWDRTFGGQPNLDYVDIRNRLRLGTSLVEVPVEGGRLRIRTGIIEGHHMWSELERLFFHVRTVDDFSKLPIPFACIGTDIETGEMVVMKGGDIVTAIRASISIPAVFTPVLRDNRELVDGGVVNNYPTDIVRDMGAGFIIGVNVSDGLRPADRLRTPVDMLLQLGVFKNADIFQSNKDITDILIEPDIGSYGTTSFSFVEELIELGKEAARGHIDELAALLPTASHPEGRERETVRPGDDYIVVQGIRYDGLRNIKRDYIDRVTGIEYGDTLTATAMRGITDRLYATGYFDRVGYSFSHPASGENYDLTLIFQEVPLASVAAALHYSSFSGAAVIAGISGKKFPFYNLDAALRVRIGEQPAIRAGVDYFAGPMKKSWFNFSWHGERRRYTLHENFSASGSYRESFNKLEFSYNNLTGQLSYFSAGINSFRKSFRPMIVTAPSLEGSYTGHQVFLRWNRYSLDQHSFPSRGQDFHFITSWNFGQTSSLDVIGAPPGEELTPEDIGIELNDYLRLHLDWRSYLPVSRRISYFTHLQAGYNHAYHQGFTGAFNIGGTDGHLRNQITFAGLSEYQIVTPSAIAFSMGLNYRLWSGIYLKPVIGAGLYDFDITSLHYISIDNLIIGAGSSAGYNSPLGPISFTLSYSPQTNSVNGYLNMGWYF